MLRTSVHLHHLAELPATQLGMHLEKRVNSFLQTSGSGAGEITIRVVSSSSKTIETKLGMREKYAGEFPVEMPYRTKAMFVFEDIDGVDVCFFGMHVQEYSSDCPTPNTRYLHVCVFPQVCLPVKLCEWCACMCVGVYVRMHTFIARTVHVTSYGILRICRIGFP